MRKTLNFLISIFLFTAFWGVAGLSVNGQNNSSILVKRGTDTITCSGTGKNIWTTNLIDLSGYQGERAIINIKLGKGECEGGFFINSEKEGLPPVGKKQTASVGFRFPKGQLGVGLGGKGAKFVLVGTGDQSSRAGSTSMFEFEVYLIGSKKISKTHCDDNEIQTSFDKNSPKYHHYGPGGQYETQICLTNNPQCNLKSVFSIMTSQIKFITPSVSSSPVKNCMEIDANPILGASDFVRTVIDVDKFSVTNYTRKKHRFYPGKITRRIFEKNGRIFVSTEGEGTGEHKALNEIMAPYLWRGVDGRLYNFVQQSLPRKFRF